MQITISNEQLEVLADRLIERSSIDEMKDYLIKAHELIKKNDRTGLSYLIGSLKDRRYNAFNASSKVQLWNGFINKINKNYNTKFICFKEEVDTSFVDDLGDNIMDKLNKGEI